MGPASGLPGEKSLTPGGRRGLSVCVAVFVADVLPVFVEGVLPVFVEGVLPVFMEGVLLVFVATSGGFVGCVSVIAVVWGGTGTVALYCVCPV